MTYFQDLSKAQRDSFLAAHDYFSDAAHEPVYEQLIELVASLQGWLEYYVKTDRFPENVGNFFAEAVNDAILAYYFARVGTWRPAYQSLRSTLENSLYFLYYKDHPVELKLWEAQQHRMGFTALHGYLKGHPDLAVFNLQITGLEAIDASYASLSRAVHGSVEYFRMVSKAPNQELPSIHVHSPIELSHFKTALRKLVEAINQLFVAVFRADLQGTSLPLLRQGVANTIGPKRRTLIKTLFKVTLQKP